MLKPSKFIIPVELDGKIALFQTLTSSVVRMNNDFYNKFFVNRTYCGDEDELIALKRMGYFVDDDCDEVYKLSVIRKQHQYSKNGISNAVIAVTTDCNARCYYCYENGIERAPMSMDTAAGVVDFLDKNCKNRKLVIQWFGGEPLCADDVIDYISTELVKRGIELSGLITTNGYAITEEICRKAKDVWNVKRFQVPVDAIGEAYNRIKNYKDIQPDESPFHRLIDNIHMLLNFGFHVNVRTNFNPNDIEPSREVLRYLAKKFKGENRFFAYPAPITGANMQSVVDFKAEEGKLHPYLDLLLETRNLGFFCPTLLKEENYLEGDEALSGISLASRPTGCYATLPNVFAIDSKGDLYKCHRMLGRGKECTCGNVFDGVSYNKTLKEFCDDTPCYDECALMPICHGGCKVKKQWYGSVNGCMAIKGIVNELIRIYICELDRQRKEET